MNMNMNMDTTVGTRFNVWFTAAVVLLAFVLVAGGNWHGAYSLSVDMGFGVTAASGVGTLAGSITVFLFSMYLTRKAGWKRAVVHVFSGFLMVIAITHYFYAGVVTSATATNAANVVDSRVAAKRAEMATIDKQVETLALTLTGGDIEALRTAHNTAMQATFKGKRVWDITRGCTATGSPLVSHPNDCAIITNTKAALDAEVQRIGGAAVVSLMQQKNAIQQAVADLEGEKVLDNDKAARAGYLHYMAGDVDLMAMVTVFAVLASFVVELVTSHAFVVATDMLNPTDTENKDKPIWVTLKEWVSFTLHMKQRAMNVQAAAEAKEKVRVSEEVRAEKRGLAKEKATIKRDIHAYLKALSPEELGKMMDKAGCDASDRSNSKFNLRTHIMGALALYEPGGRIVQSMGNGLHNSLPGCSQSQLRSYVLPAMEKLGFVAKTDAYYWCGEPVMWGLLDVPLPVTSGMDSNTEVVACDNVVNNNVVTLPLKHVSNQLQQAGYF